MMTQFVEPQEMDQIANKQTLIHEYVENYVKLCTSQLSTQFSKSQVRIIENISTCSKLLHLGSKSFHHWNWKTKTAYLQK